MSLLLGWASGAGAGPRRNAETAGPVVAAQSTASTSGAGVGGESTRGAPVSVSEVTGGPPSVQHPRPSAEAREAALGRLAWTAFPIVGFAPETSWVFGAFAALHFDSPWSGPVRLPDGTLSRPPKRSTLALVGLYSLRQQFILALEPTFYLDDGRWRLSAALSGTWVPNIFYALGPDSTEDSAEDYEQRAFGLGATAERKLVGDFYLGWNVEAATAKLTEVEAGGALASGSVVGSRGGQLLGWGPTLAWDSRDRDASPNTGGRYVLTMNTFQRVLGTDFGFSRLTIDLRRYVSTTLGQVLALQLFSQHLAGSAPFQRLAALAGDARMRGFFATRYLDKHTTVAQAEYRAHLFWRVGVVGFVGTGLIAPRVSEYRADNLKVAGGLGLRLGLNPRDGINLRMDYGRSSDGDSNVYIQFGEAF